MDLSARLLRKAKALPKVKQFFCGKNLPKGFRIPSDMLLYCHDFPHPRTIISSRYMLVIPFTEMTYRIKDASYQLGKGRALLVNPYLPRSVPPCAQAPVRLLVSFLVEGEQRYMPSSPLLEMSDDAWTHASVLVERYSEGRIMEAAFALTLLLGELSKKPLETEGVEVSASVNRAMASINERLGESFGIKEIAALCDISASHLRKLFRLELGVSIGDYIARRRLASALQLISGKGMKIKELASACGYKSIYAFSRFFKRRTGVSPSRYRLGERKRRRFSSEALLDGFHDAKRSERRSPTKKARRLRKGAGPEKDA